MYLIDIYKTFYPNAEEYIFFSSAHGTFFRTYHGLGHKTSRGKFIKTEIIPSIFLEHSTMRLEINYKKKTMNRWRLNNMLLNSQWITKEIKEEIKKYLKKN